MPAPVFTVESPDSRFVAEIIEPDGDLIPTNLVRISVRRSGHLFAREVYAGKIEPNIRWSANGILELIYPSSEQKPTCNGSLSEISVNCKEIPREDFKPELRE